MINKVELIRPLLRIKEDLNRISIPEEWEVEDVDVEFITEFKKIYEIGIDNLESFIDKLNSEGKDLNEYTIQYYKRNLLNGPFAKLVSEYAKGSTYFKNMSESMGVKSRSLKTLNNVEQVESAGPNAPMIFDNLSMTPSWLQAIVSNAENQVTEVHRKSMYHKLGYDNTLPEIDKGQQRYNTIGGELNKKSHGNYAVADSYFYDVALVVSSDILVALSKYFDDEETLRLWGWKTAYNPFSDDNNAISPISIGIKESKDQENFLNYSILKYLKDDLTRRGFKIKIEKEEEVKEYLVHTSDGALDV